MIGRLRNVVIVAGIWAACFLVVDCSSSHGVTTSWNTDFNGTFTSPANWDNGVPNGDDIASFIRPDASYTLIFPARFRSLTAGRTT